MANDEAIQGARKRNLVPGSGRKKGGKMYPRIALEQALEYSKKLVSKTAITALPEGTVLSGVFGSIYTQGKVRLSAVKQFGLLEGTAKGYKASSLAKDIDSAGDEPERVRLVQRAFFSAAVFKELYNTFQNDQASKMKIKGRAQQFGVHPELAEICAELFMSSAVTAKLATAENDGVRLASTAEVEIQAPGDVLASSEAPAHEDEEETDTGLPPNHPQPEVDRDGSGFTPDIPRPRTAADVRINLTVDSSLDIDKLEKHLASLRRFGLI